MVGAACAAAALGALIALRDRSAARGSATVSPTAAADVAEWAAADEEPARDAPPTHRELVSPPSTAAAAPTNAAVRPRDDADGLLRVRLVDAAGEPITTRYANVGASDEAGEELAAKRVDAGRFELRLPAAGRWWVRARTFGYEQTVRELVLPSLEGEHELELTLATAATVRVLLLTPTGAAFENARPSRLEAPVAVAMREPPGRWLTQGALDPERCGDFQPREQTDLDLRHLGSVELRCDPPLWIALVLGQGVLDVRRVEEGTHEVTFAHDPHEFERCFAELRLRLVDAVNGETLPGGFVVFQSTPSSLALAKRQAGAGLLFEDVPAGPLQLELQAPGYANRVIELLLQGGETKDLGDLALVPRDPGTLEVRVLGSEGADDLEVAYISRSQLEAWRDGAGLWDTAKPSDATARIELSHGPWIVWAEAKRAGDRLSTERREVEMKGSRFELSLELVPCAPLVFRPPTRELDAQIFDALGLPLVPFALTLEGLPARVKLVPGSYELVVYEPGLPPRTQRFQLPPGGTTVLVE